MEVRLLNYLPDMDNHFLDNGIAWWSRLWNLKAPKELVCSHSEIWTLDSDFGSKWRRRGLCWTSTMRGEDNGVVMRPAAGILDHPHRWTYFKIVIPDEFYPSLIAEMTKKVNSNLGYDKVTILSFFLPWRLGNPDKYICSEFCHLSLYPHSCGDMRLFRSLSGLNAPSPIRLAHRVWLAGYDLYSLETNEVILKGKSA